MTYQANDKLNESLLEPLLNKGLDGLPEALTIMLNQAMEIERQRYLHAEPYERTDQRTSHANGYKPKQLKARVGKLDLLVP